MTMSFEDALGKMVLSLCYVDSEGERLLSILPPREHQDRKDFDEVLWTLLNGHLGHKGGECFPPGVPPEELRRQK